MGTLDDFLKAASSLGPDRFEHRHHFVVHINGIDSLIIQA